MYTRAYDQILLVFVPCASSMSHLERQFWELFIANASFSFPTIFNSLLLFSDGGGRGVDRAKANSKCREYVKTVIIVIGILGVKLYFVGGGMLLRVSIE